MVCVDASFIVRLLTSPDPYFNALLELWGSYRSSGTLGRIWQRLTSKSVSG